MWSGGGVGSLGFPIHTDLLKRPFITGACHLLVVVMLIEDFSAVTVATLTVLKLTKCRNKFTFSMDKIKFYYNFLKSG